MQEWNEDEEKDGEEDLDEIDSGRISELGEAELSVPKPEKPFYAPAIEGVISTFDDHDSMFHNPEIANWFRERFPELQGNATQENEPHTLPAQTLTEEEIRDGLIRDVIFDNLCSQISEGEREEHRTELTNITEMIFKALKEHIESNTFEEMADPEIKKQGIINVLEEAQQNAQGQIDDINTQLQESRAQEIQAKKNQGQVVNPSQITGNTPEQAKPPVQTEIHRPPQTPSPQTPSLQTPPILNSRT